MSITDRAREILAQHGVDVVTETVGGNSVVTLQPGPIMQKARDLYWEYALGGR